MKRHVLFALCWLGCTAILLVLPYSAQFGGRDPSGSYPLDGATNTSIRHQYLVFPKVHHAQFPEIRKSFAKINEQIDEFASTAEQAQEIKDSMVDFANPVTVVVMPPVTTPCASLVERYPSHSAALTRALQPYWVSGGLQNCTEIIVSVVDQDGDQHLDFKSVRRETGRVLIMNDKGGALAQMILWRDDLMKINNAQVQPIDPLLDIGSGFSTLPLDWPRLETHRQNVKAISDLRFPKDPFLTHYLQKRGQLPWQCHAQLLGLDYRDSWGRSAKSQWCYGDSFPKVIENDHYYAFRVEE